MKQTATVTIALTVEGKTIDLKIPTAVSVHRLKLLLQEALQLLHIALPTDYQLAFRHKPISLADEALVSEYPIGNGDQLVLIPYRKSLSEGHKQSGGHQDALTTS